MIAITWYNLVAIVVGFISIYCWKFIPDRGHGMCEGLGTLIGFLIWIACVMLFYAIWGGIFWW